MATIAQIAKAAGVSPMTASRVLNGQAVYRRPTFAHRAESIRALAAKMGYRPNTSAMAVRNGRFDSIALLLSANRTWSLLPDAMLAGIERELAEQGKHLTISSFSDAELTSDTKVPKLLRHLSSDGLLINYNAMIPPRMVELIESYRLPSIWMNSKHSIDAVYPDDRSASIDATQLLLELGHRRIAYVNYTNRPNEPDDHYSFVDRHGGYAQVMRDAGLEPYRLGNADLREEGKIVSSMVGFLQSPRRPTAVIAYGLIEARVVIAAAGIAGLRVPQDLSIITFADKAVDDLGPMLTTYLLPEGEIGRESVTMLFEKIANPQGAISAKVIPLGFDPGGSIAKCFVKQNA